MKSNLIFWGCVSLLFGLIASPVNAEFSYSTVGQTVLFQGESLTSTSLYNYGFETPMPEVWINEVNYSINSYARHNGSMGLSLTSTDGDDYVDFVGAPIPASTNVIVSAWVYSPTATFVATPDLYENGGGFAHITNWQQLHFIPANQWVKLSNLGTTDIGWGGLANFRIRSSYYENATPRIDQTVYWDDLKIENINSTLWSWNFGDGQTSTSPDPIHTYAYPGIYNVSLILSNSTETNTYNHTLYIGVAEPNNLIPKSPLDGKTTSGDLTALIGIAIILFIVSIIAAYRVDGVSVLSIILMGLSAMLSFYIAEIYSNGTLVVVTASGVVMQSYNSATSQFWQYFALVSMGLCFLMIVMITFAKKKPIFSTEENFGEDIE